RPTWRTCAWFAGHIVAGGGPAGIMPTATTARGAITGGDIAGIIGRPEKSGRAERPSAFGRAYVDPKAASCRSVRSRARTNARLRTALLRAHLQSHPQTR